MKADQFIEMTVEVAREHVNRHGLKVLIKNTGEFYADFFRYGHWRPDFPEKLRILTDAGLDLNKPICGGRREKEFPMFVVISQRDRHTAPAITALVSCGANINVQNVEGKTPIMVASTGRWTYYRDLSKPSIVKALIKAGADLSLKDNKENLVTDLADSKALPILIAAGAPVNKKSEHALSTAIWAEDINLTRILLQKGLQLKLDGRTINQKLAFLETVAQTVPELFVEGFSLEDSEQHPTDKKTVKAYKVLLELCTVELNKYPANVESEDMLPASLRSGAWPPLKPKPTAPIDVTAQDAPAPRFSFPADLQLACEQICESSSDEEVAAKARSDFSALISTAEEIIKQIEDTDWGSLYDSFFGQSQISMHQSWSLSRVRKADDLLQYIQNIGLRKFYCQKDGRYATEPKKPLRLYYGIKFETYLDHDLSIPIIGDVKIRIWTNDENLINNVNFILFVEQIECGRRFIRHAEQYCHLRQIGDFEKSDIVKYLNLFYFDDLVFITHQKHIQYCVLACKIGPDISASLQQIARTGDEHALECLTHLDAETLAPFMAEMLTLPGKTKHAQAWFRFFPETVINGLLKCSFGGDLAERNSAQQALRFIARKSSRQVVIDCALKFGHEAQSMAIEFMGHDARADFLPNRMPKLPAYFIASAHPAPILKNSGKPLPAHAVETLVRMMLVSTCHLQNSALQDVIEACDRHSLADFALSTFEMWSRNGVKKAGIGFLHALAYFGDNRAAVLLSKTHRHAPPTVATPVIEVLAAMGSNTAIAGIQAIARTSVNEKSREVAQEVLEDVARDRGLTPNMLEDLAVPDLGLGSDGQMPLDFGPRRFVAKVDFMLAPILIAEDGNVLKALPKALKSDDASKAAAATARWKEFTASLKSHGADQRKRFEQAMLSRREWDGGTFKEVVSNHPLLAEMVRSLVWAKMKDQTIDTTFRVDAGGRFVTANGAELSLVDEARVTLPHPLLLGEAIAAWVQIFAEHQLAQPFPQLARKWFAKNADTEALIRARDGTKVPLGSLRGLKAKDWVFDEGGAGMIWSIFKSVDGGRASVDVEPGWSISGFDYEDFGGDQTVKMEVYGSDPITYSELVRELLSLPIAEG